MQAAIALFFVGCLIIADSAAAVDPHLYFSRLREMFLTGENITPAPEQLNGSLRFEPPPSSIGISGNCGMLFSRSTRGDFYDFRAMRLAMNVIQDPIVGLTINLHGDPIYAGRVGSDPEVVYRTKEKEYFWQVELTGPSPSWYQNRTFQLRRIVWVDGSRRQTYWIAYRAKHDYSIPWEDSYCYY